jgi:putative transposase
MIEAESRVSIRRQCDLLGINRSGIYYRPAQETELNLELMNWLDKTYTNQPFLGTRRMTVMLCEDGYSVNRKRVQRLMRKMGISAIYPKKKLSSPNKEHKIFPYLLRGVQIIRSNQVWSTDITYIRMEQGFLYLMAIMDWYSRYVLSWRLSNTLDKQFCLEALEEALERYETPEIFNSDQGSQFTSPDFTGHLLKAGAQVSMDGRGRCYDNIFIERLWRSVKYEEVYLKVYSDGLDALDGLTNYFRFYNKQRPHQSLDYKTPQQMYSNLSLT